MRAYAHDRHRFPLPSAIASRRRSTAWCGRRSAGSPDVTILEADADHLGRRAARRTTRSRVRRVRYRPARPARGGGARAAVVARARRRARCTPRARRWPRRGAALQDGTAAALGGGTHHARHRTGRGYCVFNDVAIAIAGYSREGLAGDLLVLDLTSTRATATPSSSRQPHGHRRLAARRAQLPVERVPSDLDVDPARRHRRRRLPGGARRRRWRGRSTGRALRRLAFLIAGADPWEHDALGRLSLTEAGLDRRDRRRCGAARRWHPGLRHARGGYGQPIEGTARIQPDGGPGRRPCGHR